MSASHQQQGLDAQLSLRLSRQQREYLRRRAADIQERLPVRCGEGDVIRGLIDEAIKNDAKAGEQ